MSGTGIITFILIISNFIFSYRGFVNRSFFEGYKFRVDRILVNKDYKRMVTSGFLHLDWAHLIFNMLSLYFFSGQVESVLGSSGLLIVYFVSLTGGNLLSLFIHRHHGDYSAVGASGAVGGVIFSCIALFPGMNIGFFLIPVAIPAWIYGLAYILFTIYAIRSRNDNVGHDAHLGGILLGMITGLLLYPAAFAENYLTILLIIIPIIVFIFLIIKRPQALLVDNHYYKSHHDHYSIDHKYNEERAHRQKELDRILDKISRKGMSSLTASEKQALKEYSKKDM
jgi:membrane associated rhomboid family serine protease